MIPEIRTLRLHHVLEDTRALLVDHINTTIGALQDTLARMEDRQPHAVITPETVLTVVGEYLGHSSAELRGPRRHRDLARARQIAMHLTRELTDLSLPRIGRVFGGRDHTTVMHAVTKIRHEIGEVPDVGEQIANLTELIRQRAVVDALRGPQKKGRVA